MNRVWLVGRVVRDPELRYSMDQKKCTARFTLAVDRQWKDAGTDFIGCLAWNNIAEWMDKYGRKGIKLGIVGKIHTDSYTNKDGKKIYTTDVVLDDYPEFMEKKEQKEDAKDGFMQIPDDAPAELPFE